MITSKYATDPDFVAAVAKVASREATRQQAAESLGISLAVFNVRLSRSKLNLVLKDTRDYSGDHLYKPDNVKAEAYNEAVALSLQAKSSRFAHQKFPHLSYQVLCRKVKAAREKADAG
jgi:hypothetical protein